MRQRGERQGDPQAAAKPQGAAGLGEEGPELWGPGGPGWKRRRVGDSDNADVARANDSDNADVARANADQLATGHPGSGRPPEKSARRAHSEGRGVADSDSDGPRGDTAMAGTTPPSMAGTTPPFGGQTPT